MKRQTEYNHLFFQKMQSGALILKSIKQAKNEVEFEIISNNEYIFDMKQIDDVLSENMLSNISKKSELFSAIESAVKKFYYDGIENHRYIFKDKSLLLKMNIFYIQKGIICVLIREKQNTDKHHEILSDELLEIYNLCLTELDEYVIISDYDTDSILISNLSKKNAQLNQSDIKSKKLSEFIKFNKSIADLKKDLEDNPNNEYSINCTGFVWDGRNFENTIMAKMKIISINDTKLLLTIGSLK